MLSLEPSTILILGAIVIGIGVMMIIYTLINYFKIKRMKEFLEQKMRFFTHFIITDFKRVYVFHNVIVDVSAITLVDENEVYNFVIPDTLTEQIYKEQEEARKKLKEKKPSPAKADDTVLERKILFTPSDFIIEYEHEVKSKEGTKVEKVGLLFGGIDENRKIAYPIFTPMQLKYLIETRSVISALMDLIGLLYQARINVGIQFFWKAVDIYKKLVQSSDAISMIKAVAYLVASSEDYFRLFAEEYNRYATEQKTPEELLDELKDYISRTREQVLQLLNSLPPNIRAEILKYAESSSE